jgi:hypothetical protein
MPPVGFEPAIPVDERQQTHALDSSATGIGYKGNIRSYHGKTKINYEGAGICKEIIGQYGSSNVRVVMLLKCEVFRGVQLCRMKK